MDINVEKLEIMPVGLALGSAFMAFEAKHKAAQP